MTDYTTKRLDSFSKAVQEARSRQAMKGVRVSHHFTFFRVGVDVCAWCGKPRKEHE